MKKLTTLALAALLTTVTATSVFAASTATQDTTVGYTVGGNNPGNVGNYIVEIPKNVNIKQSEIGADPSKNGAVMDVVLKAYDETTGEYLDTNISSLPAGLSVNVAISTANSFKLKTTKLTTGQDSIDWKYYYVDNAGDFTNGMTTVYPTADSVMTGSIGDLTPTNGKIKGKAVVPTAPSVITDSGIKFTDTVTYTITETANGVTA